MKVLTLFLLTSLTLSCSSQKKSEEDLSAQNDLDGTSEMVKNETSDSIAESLETILYEDIQEYQVQRFDTLMMISFKVYGDFDKWREIADLNPHLQKKSYLLEIGEKIKFKVPTEPFKWNPQGLPYLIRQGDTLGKISYHVYETSKRWPEIYENNRPMIADPETIYAGFTLFYIPDNEEIKRLPAKI